MNHSGYHSKIINGIISSVYIDLITFLIISFYFSYNSLTSRNIQLKKQKIIRLVIPYIIWPLIFFGINNLIEYKYSKNNINFKLLYNQLIIGNGIHSVFWFQFNLIFLYIFYTIIILLSPKHYLFYLFFNGILCYLFIIKYYDIFFQKFKYIVSFSTRPIPFSFLYTFSGFLLYYINIIDKINNHVKKIIILFFIAIIFKKLFINISLSIFNNILLSSCLFIIFFFLPFEKINNDKIIYIIKIITNYTGGIYYLHTKIRDILVNFFIKKKYLTLFQCFINYLICYFICFFCSKIFRNYYLKYMFF